ncbi:MAG: ATP-binding protein [Pseudomonadota bacterium]
MTGLFARLKRSMPRSLFGRALLILILPILLLQAIVSTVLVNRHYDGVTLQMASDVARELDFIVTEIDAAEDRAGAEALLAAAERPLGLSFQLNPDGRVEPQALMAFYDVTGGVIEETLKSGVSRPMTIDLVSVPKAVVARVLTAKGVLYVSIPRRQLNPTNPHQLLLITNLAAAGLVAIAVLFLRNQVRPIRELAAASQAFGRGVRLPFRPSGAEEVRRAGHAFLDMRARIDRQLQTRTSMLSGVSHDLRTPLTRMRLSLALLPADQDTAAIGQDIAEMERMLESFLAFARGEAAEPARPTDPVAMAEEAAAEARRLGAEVALETSVEASAEPTVALRRQVVKRAIANLLDNARVYASRAQLSVRLSRRVVEFTVEDDGPGIPVERREEMLRPFTRLDGARGQDTGAGVGLGLSIALDAARGHGGTLELGESRGMGGLRATLRLPRSAGEAADAAPAG